MEGGRTRERRWSLSFFTCCVWEDERGREEDTARKRLDNRSVRDRQTHTIQVFLIAAESHGTKTEWTGGEEYIYLTCLKTLGSSSKRGMEERKEVGRREEREEVGRTKEGGEKVEGRGGDKDTLFTHLFCDPTSQETIVTVFLMTVNSPVTVEVSKVVRKTWNLIRMDLGGGIHLTCLRTLCSKLAEQYNTIQLR